MTTPPHTTMTQHRTATHQEPLSRDRILRAALVLVDREGLDALSMRRLAGELGVAPMSLYHHVEKRSALEAGILELVMADGASGSPGVGRAGAIAAAGALRRALLDHPTLVPLLATDAGRELVLGVADQVLDAYGRDTLDGDAAIRMLQLVMWFVVGAVVVPVAGPLLTDADWRRSMDESFKLGLGALLDRVANG